MNSLRPRLRARFAAPQRLFLTHEGQVLPAGLPFADWCAAHPGAAVELAVSARLLHELVCEPGLPLHGDEALRAYAHQQFSHYFGAVALRWPVAAWRAGRAQRGASALHGLDWAALLQAAAAHGVDLRSARPAWAPLLQQLEAPERALAWIEGALLSWIRLDDAGDVVAVRQQRLAAATPAALVETLSELRDGEAGGQGQVLLAGYGLSGPLPALPGVRRLGRLDAAVPDPAAFARPARPRAALPLPDFLGERVRRSLLAWPLAATGLLVLATAGWSAWHSHQQRALAQADAAVLQARLEGRRPLAGTRAAVGRGPEAEARLRGAVDAQALLQQNWEPLLANVEQAGAGRQLAWLALDYQAGRNALRLEGLVQDKAVALALVDRLAVAPGWGEVVLSRFQAAEQGATGQRFELGATLQPARMQRELPMETPR